MALKRTKKRLCVAPPKRDAAAGKGTCVTFTDKTKERLLVFPSKQVMWRPRWSPRCFPSLLASSAHRALSEPPAGQLVAREVLAAGGEGVATASSSGAPLCACRSLCGSRAARNAGDQGMQFPGVPACQAERLRCAPFRKRSCSCVEGRSEVPSRRSRSRRPGPPREGRAAAAGGPWLHVPWFRSHTERAGSAFRSYGALRGDRQAPASQGLRSMVFGCFCISWSVGLCVVSFPSPPPSPPISFPEFIEVIYELL